MSKAFTSEENEDEGFVDFTPLPAGIKNYVTLNGAKKLDAEIARLREEEKQLGKDFASENQRRDILKRLRYLADRIERAEVIDPLKQPKDQARFGATILFEDQKGQKQQVRIVGLDEVDLDQGWISWMSPLASVLAEKKVGERVSFQDRTLTIHNISYTA